MARFNDVDAFLAVAEAGSFRGAAARLKVTKSTVSRAVARLEAYMDTSLLLRDTSSVRLTDAGVAYRRGARRAAAALAEAEQAARCVAGDVSGTLSVTAPPAFGQGVLAPMFADFLVDYPALQLDLRLTDRIVNPIIDGVDLAIRTGDRLADSDLKSRKLATFVLAAYAAPEMAERLDAMDVVPVVQFARADGSVHAFGDPPKPLSTRMRVNDYLALRDAVSSGAGIGVIGDLVAAPWVEAGRLVPVWQSWQLPRPKLWAVYPARGVVPKRLRVLLDHLVVAFGARTG